MPFDITWVFVNFRWINASRCPIWLRIRRKIGSFYLDFLIVIVWKCLEKNVNKEICWIGWMFKIAKAYKSLQSHIWADICTQKKLGFGLGYPNPKKYHPIPKPKIINTLTQKSHIFWFLGFYWVFFGLGLLGIVGSNFRIFAKKSMLWKIFQLLEFLGQSFDDVWDILVLFGLEFLDICVSQPNSKSTFFFA